MRILNSSLPSTGRSPAVETVSKRIGSDPMVLMVGTVEPRKGYDNALAAFDHLWSKQSSTAPHLVIVGKPGWKTTELQSAIEAHPELGRRLHWIRDASDEALSELYKRSSGLLLASKAEGCGLPVLEAAVHGRRSQSVTCRYFGRSSSPAHFILTTTGRARSRQS